MAIANITLDNGTEINGINVPEWLAPNVVDYLDRIAAVQAAAVEVAVAYQAHTEAEAELLSKQQALASAQQAVNDIMAAIAANIGGN